MNENDSVYVRTDDAGHIIDINSSGFLSDLTGWTEIDQGQGDKYHHAQGNYLPGPLMTDGGAYRYKLVNGKVVECTPEEIAEEEKSPDSYGWKDLLEAQVLYTALMTGTLLEE